MVYRDQVILKIRGYAILRTVDVSVWLASFVGW